MLRRGNRKRRETPRVPLPRINWVRVTGVAGVLAVLAAGYFGARWLFDRPIQRVVVNGEFERVSADQFDAVLRAYIGKGFLAANLDRVQARVASIPWVATARISRRWPDTLVVTVTEEQPAARWGEDGLLNAQGRLFVEHASHVPAELPRLNGPPGSESQVAARYVAIQEQMVQRGLGVVALDLDQRGDWSFQLTNGIQVRLGAVSVDERLHEFFQALDRVIAPRAEEIQYVDMRYTNGFAVGWKQEQAAPTRVAGQEPGANAQKG